MDPSHSFGPAQAGFHISGSAPAAITITEPAWRRVIRNAETVARRAAKVAHTDAAIILASDQAVQKLNFSHRGRNKPTNVLTYPPSGFGERGEIVLALGTVRREAIAAGRSPAHHLAHLIVHGALHLAGHDHHHPGDARRMERAESRLLHRMRVPNPWRSV
ncbi:MAG: rRNA maturation RNase YbeY [Acetobacteraceae bacterium]|nr:rRNA maturation RNase YbeY [Acetobacteraceae bacterium]